MKIWFDNNDVSMNGFCSEQILISPFLPIDYIKKHPSFTDIEDYMPIIRTYVQYSTIEDCDYIVFPSKMNTGGCFMKYVGMAKEYGKKLIAFYIDDNGEPMPDMDNVILFKSSLFKSTRKQFEHAMPVWSIDFKKYGMFTPRKYDKLTVGFCGYVNHPETDIRRRCISSLISNSRIVPNFIIRNQFWGGKIDSPVLRREYVDNMAGSDFILCVRGTGNFSYRLYETMSAGRIPILVNTDCVLPSEDRINYGNYFPVINEKDIEHIGDIILDYWNAIKTLNYADIQETIRNIYVKYLSPYGFIQQLDKRCP